MYVGTFEKEWGRRGGGGREGGGKRDERGRRAEKQTHPKERVPRVTR